MGKLFSTTVPEIEIHMSNEPIAIMLLSSGQIKPYKIKSKGRYFTIFDRKGVKGIFTINNKYRYSWGKTPVYFYVVQETNPVDPVIINELNKFKVKNKLTEIKRKDVVHASRFRNLMMQKKKDGNKSAMQILKDEVGAKDKELQENVDLVEKGIETRVRTLKEKHQKDVDITSGQKSYILLEHLKETKQIDDLQYTEFSNKVNGNIMTYDNLIDELRNLNVVAISEPLDENVEDFIQDLGAQSAADLAGFVGDLRTNKKGLKDMTASPVKSFIPASLLFVIIIGFLIGIPIIVSQLPLIDNYLSGKSGGGVAGNPFQDLLNFGGGFIYELANHIPKFILGLVS
ncbi:MAG: hypothetical protein GTO44_10005 [Hydrotalea flava]|nr:hypothetical protein [Hydrotalea flava]NIN15386.1 hypothetical protein [Hydrotalea flava]